MNNNELIRSILFDNTLNEETYYAISKCVELWNKSQDNVSMEKLSLDFVLRQWNISDIDINKVNKEIEYAKFRLDDLLSQDEEPKKRHENLNLDEFICYHKAVINNLNNLKKIILKK